MTTEIYCGEPEGERHASDLFGGREKILKEIQEATNKNFHNRRWGEIKNILSASYLDPKAVIGELESKLSLETAWKLTGVIDYSFGEPNFKDEFEREYWTQRAEANTEGHLLLGATGDNKIACYTRASLLQELFGVQ